MRSLLYVFALAAALLVAGPAHAQFSNRSAGASAVFMWLNGTAGLDTALLVGLDGSIYLENGWELITLSKFGFPYDGPSQQYVAAFAPSVGVRYLFMEERIRPYVGADINYLFVFKPANTVQLVGVGPNAGLDLFLTDSVSLGVRGQFALYVMLNQPLTTAASVSAGASFYF